jgi:hypothetical protein
VERAADLLAEPFAEGIALNKGMKTEPPCERGQCQQNRNGNQNVNAFHTNEISDRE